MLQYHLIMIHNAGTVPSIIKIMKRDSRKQRSLAMTNFPGSYSLNSIRAGIKMVPKNDQGHEREI